LPNRLHLPDAPAAILSASPVLARGRLSLSEYSPQSGAPQYPLPASVRLRRKVKARETFLAEFGARDFSTAAGNSDLITDERDLRVP